MNSEEAQTRIAAILVPIDGNLKIASFSSLLAECFQQAFRWGQLPQESPLFEGLYWMCGRDAVLALARLWDPHKDANSVDYLLRFSEQNPQGYSHASPGEVRKSVAEHRQFLADHATRTKVKALRDQVLAHSDKKIFTERVPTLGEVREAYDQTLEIVNVYRRFHGKSEISTDIEEHHLQTEFDYLVRLWQEAGRR
jgi:AbiU2